MAIPHHTSAVSLLEVLSLYTQPGKEQVVKDIICPTVNSGEVRVRDQ